MNCLNILEKNCVLIGSFRKHYSHIVDLMGLIEDKCNILSPLRSRVVDAMDDFVILDSDILNARCEDELQISFIESKVLENIRKASFVYIHNPGGYIGISTAFEIGFAVKEHKIIFSSHSPRDKFFKPYIKRIISPDDLRHNGFNILFETQENVMKETPSMLRSLEACNKEYFYVHNPEGYIDLKSAFNIGYAIGAEKEIHTSFRPNDIMISKFISDIHLDKGAMDTLRGLYGEQYNRGLIESTCFNSNHNASVANRITPQPQIKIG